MTGPLLSANELARRLDVAVISIYRWARLGRLRPTRIGRLLTIAEACPLLGAERQTIYNSIYSGTGELAKLPFYRVGRSIRFAETDINVFLERRRVDLRGGTGQ